MYNNGVGQFWTKIIGNQTKYCTNFGEKPIWSLFLFSFAWRPNAHICFKVWHFAKTCARGLCVCVKKFAPLHCAESLCENIVQEQSRSLCKNWHKKNLWRRRSLCPCLVWRTCATTCVLNSSDKKDMEKVIAQRNDKQKKKHWKHVLLNNWKKVVLWMICCQCEIEICSSWGSCKSSSGFLHDC